MNRLTSFRAAAFVIVLALSLVLAACSSSGLIVALDVAEVAASASVPVIQAFAGQLGTTAALASSYAQGISNACAESVTELKTTDSKAIQDTKIAGYFANVAALSLPTGTVSEVLAVISAIGSAVNVILNEVGAAKVTASAPTPGAAVLLAKYQAQVKALGSDKARLQDIMTRAAQFGK